MKVVEDGFFVRRWDSGNKKLEGTFENGKKNGFFIEYNEDGTKLEEGKYADGCKEGVWKGWYVIGETELMWEGEYKNYNKVGTWLYSDNNGLLNGVIIFLNDEGTKIQETVFNNGVHNGYSKQFRDDAIIFCEEIIENGIFLFETSYDENGIRYEDRDYKNGRKNEHVTEWYENGIRKREGNLKDWEIYGLVTYWMTQGEL